jgi:hypothetical protein
MQIVPEVEKSIRILQLRLGKRTLFELLRVEKPCPI